MSKAQARAVAALRSDILTGKLASGEQLIQEDLADEYGVSRIPLREAMQLLAAEGLVEHIPNRGFFVAELSVPDLIEIYRLRKILESEATRAALPALRDEDVRTLRELAGAVVEAADAGDIPALTAANRAFHFALFDAADMPRLTRMLGQLWDASEMYRAVYFHEDTNRERIVAEHEELLAAIADRDAKRVVRLHDQHRGNSVSWVRDQLTAQ